MTLVPLDARVDMQGFIVGDGKVGDGSEQKQEYGGEDDEEG